MVQVEILGRVLRIRYGNMLGTAFTVEDHGEQFLVTAKHIFKDDRFPAETTINLLINQVYLPFEVEIRYPEAPQVDIAVIKLKKKQFLTPVFPNTNTVEGITLGQDVYFVGFPFEYDSVLGMFPGNDKPIPFVKKACLSAILYDEVGTIILDGINNPGFSGSPVCYKRIGTTDKTMGIIGVVSGYRNNNLPLFDQSGNQMPYYVKENSGLIIVSNIAHANKLIEKWT